MDYRDLWRDQLTQPGTKIRSANGSFAISSAIERCGFTGLNTISGGATVSTIGAVEFLLLAFSAPDIGTSYFFRAIEEKVHQTIITST